MSKSSLLHALSCFLVFNPRYSLLMPHTSLLTKETRMDEGQGQGIAWIVFAVWLLGPLLTLFLILTFTG